MLHYADGQDVRLGDFVDFDGTPGTVFDLVETEDDLRRTGLPEQMVGFTTEPYGEVYQSLTDAGWSEVVLLHRASE